MGSSWGWGSRLGRRHLWGGRWLRKALYVTGIQGRGQREQVDLREPTAMCIGLGQGLFLVRHRHTEGMAWIAENGPESGRGGDH